MTRLLPTGLSDGPDTAPDSAAYSAPEDRLELIAVIRPIWTRRWPVLGVTLATALMFLIVTLMQEKTYSAVATVMLDPREQKVVAQQDEVVADLQLNSPILESEVAVIRSSTLLESAVRRIGLDRFGVIDPVTASAAPLRDLLGVGRAQAAGAADPLIPPDQRRMTRITRALRQGMTVARVGESYVIEVAVTTVDPELSALVANTLTDVYIEYQLGDRRRVAEQATRWIADQVEERRDEVAEAEAAVEAFKKNQLIQTGSTIEVLEQQLAELNQQLVLTRSDRATEEARLEQVDRLRDERGAIAAAETQASAHISGLRQSRSELLRDDARLASAFGPRHPDRQRIATELAQIDAAIAAEVAIIAEGHRAEIAVLGTREAALAGAVTGIEARIADMATSSLRLRQLEREAEAARDTFQELLARLGETRAQAEIQRAEARIVSPAQIPEDPSAPRPKLMAAFGGTLGLTVAMVVALALDLVSAGYINAADLERATDRPVLSALPTADLSAPRDVIAHLSSQPYSLLSERVRQVRALLDTAAPPDRAQRIALVSSIPDEGKTTTALALAQSFAMTGLRTILVDLDTRRAQLVPELAQDMLFDLENYFDGSARIEDVIAPVEQGDFWIAGTRARIGVMADRVTETALHQLVEDLSTDFDVIILDAPPVLAVSDGLSIAKVADSLLYLVQYRRTSRRSVAYGMAALHHAGLVPTGLVMTRVDAVSDPDLYAADYTYDARTAPA